MKKILCLVLSFIMLCSMGVFAETSEELSAEQLLTQYYEQHKDELYPDTTKDVETAFLADLDNDGEPELIFSRGVYFYGLTVYKVKDGQVVEIPERIAFGRGTGINEDRSFLLDEEGYLSIYREGVHIIYNIEDGKFTKQAIYDWAEEGVTPISCLDMAINYGNFEVETGYTTDCNVFDQENAPKISITPEEADAKFEEFKNRVAPYVVWKESELAYDANGSETDIGFTDIWEMQKERQKTRVPVEEALILQIGNPNMSVNGVQSEIDAGAKTAPVVQNDRTLLPVRAVVEAMGGTVDWEEETQTATLSYGENTVTLTIDSTTAYLNNESVSLDTAPVVMNDRTMLPIRFIAESFGFTVTWKGLTEQIVITK